VSLVLVRTLPDPASRQKMSHTQAMPFPSFTRHANSFNVQILHAFSVATERTTQQSKMNLSSTEERLRARARCCQNIKVPTLPPTLSSRPVIRRTSRRWSQQHILSSIHPSALSLTEDCHYQKHRTSIVKPIVNNTFGKN
jgi:hypothetical protein